MPHRSYALALLGLILTFGVVVYEKERALHAAVHERAQIAELLGAVEKNGVALGQPQRSSPCAVQGALPDQGCTPGAVFPEAPAEIICEPGYSKSVRSVSIGLKHEIYGAYGVSYPQPRGSYELDHLIPLELGGSNDRSNLWPEAAQPESAALGFREKDVVENYLHEQVCAGAIDLPAAQKQIATDWVAMYQVLSPETIAALKAQYPSWTATY